MFEDRKDIKGWWVCPHYECKDVRIKYLDSLLTLETECMHGHKVSVISQFPNSEKFLVGVVCNK